MKKSNIKIVIREIISDITNNEPVSSYALKLKVIAHHLKNENFSAWIENELEGYKLPGIVPEYRKLTTEIKANIFIDNGVKSLELINHTVPLAPLNDVDLVKEMTQVEIMFPISELETLSKIEGNESIQISTTEYERYKLADIYKNSTILSAYKPMAKTECASIVLKFKSTLLDMFMGFDDTLFNDELDFDLITKREEFDRVVTQTINAGIYMEGNASANINDNQIAIGGGNNMQMNQETKKNLVEIISQIEDLSKDVEEDREDIALEVAKIRVDLDSYTQQPKYLKSAFNSIKGVAQGVATEVIKDKIVLLVNKALALIYT